METAWWFDWREDAERLPRADRVYFGHETCAQRLPSIARAAELCRRAADGGTAVTLVLPCLTERGMAVGLRLVAHLVATFESLEVVASDWGLLRELSLRKLATPVVGRLLTAQHTDPRILRVVAPRSGVPGDRAVHPRETPTAALRHAIHLDGTLCDVEWRSPSPALVEHYRSCWIDRQEVMALLQDWGIHSCELSNTPQGIVFGRVAGWSCSLHVPEVLVAVMRQCPGPGEDMAGPAPCATCTGDRGEIPWSCDTLPVPFFRRDNALYYRWARQPQELADLPIDRLVYASGR